VKGKEIGKTVVRIVSATIGAERLRKKMMMIMTLFMTIHDMKKGNLGNAEVKTAIGIANSSYASDDPVLA
jgi:hypothetical protein